jgi:hypothetical protein
LNLAVTEGLYKRSDGRWSCRKIDATLGVDEQKSLKVMTAEVAEDFRVTASLKQGGLFEVLLELFTTGKSEVFDIDGARDDVDWSKCDQLTERTMYKIATVKPNLQGKELEYALVVREAYFYRVFHMYLDAGPMKRKQAVQVHATVVLNSEVVRRSRINQ